MSDVCKICGLNFYSQSFGGPGICPSCDCGNFGATKVKHQADRIAELESELVDWKRGVGIDKLLETSIAINKKLESEVKRLSKSYQAAIKYSESDRDKLEAKLDTYKKFVDQVCIGDVGNQLLLSKLYDNLEALQQEQKK